MILEGNLPRIYELARSGRVLDVGGWWRPFNLATHVLDLRPYDSRRHQDALDPHHAPRFSTETWVIRDACCAPWPFPDKFFDFSFCSHLLEDLRDPLIVCAELIRVSKAGYIETPSREREIFSKARFFSVQAALGRIPIVGFGQHRWFVELDGTHLRFTAKDFRLLAARRNYITRSDLGRKMTAAESGIGLFWTGGFTFEECFVDRIPLERFRDAALQRMKTAP